MRCFALFLACFASLLILGCGGLERKIDERAEEKLVAWEATHPGQAPTEEEAKAIWAEAKAEVLSELAREAGEHGIGAVTSIFTGNWVAAAFHGLGLAGIGIGLLGKRRRLVRPVAAIEGVKP